MSSPTRKTRKDGSNQADGQAGNGSSPARRHWTDRVPPHDLEAEMSLLGSLMLDREAIGYVIPIVPRQHSSRFYQPEHRILYEALLDLYDKGSAIDLVILRDELTRRGDLDRVGGVEYLVQVVQSVPSAANAEYYAGIVRDKALLRELIVASGEIIDEAYGAHEEVPAILDRAEQKFFQVTEQRVANEAVSLSGLLEDTFRQIQDRDGNYLTGVATGFLELDDMTSGLQRSELIIVAARPSMGKAQPLDAKVLTTVGWRCMGDLKVGDALASVDGEPSCVVGIYPQGPKQVYRVTFADGRSTECCAEHLWRIHYRGWPAPRVVDTAKLIELLTRKRYRNRLWIETFSGQFGVDQDLPIDPWLLGLLLGDGCLAGTSLRFSTAEQTVVEQVCQAAGPQLSVVPAGGYDYRIRQTDGAHRKGISGAQANPLTAALRQMGLWDVEAHEKFIPRAYLSASNDSRRRLLAGLLDSDGWVERWGSLRFATASERLARDVVDLVRSLGGSGSCSSKRTTYTYCGKQLDGRIAFVCNLQHRDAASLVTLPAKRDRLRVGRQRQRRLNVVSVEPTRVVPCQCIRVSHPSHLYVTDDYIVTHNTAFGLNVAEHMAVNDRKPVVFFSMEMSKQQVAQRILCSRGRIDSHRLRRGMLNEHEIRQLQMICDELRDAPLFIDDTAGMTVLELRAKARRLWLQHKIEAIFIDYLQLMYTPGAESRQQEIAIISRGLKALGRELNIPIVALAQLNRGTEGRDGHRPRMSDLRESGAIEQDADVVALLHRPSYYDPNEEPNVAEVILAKQRNGPTGTVKLHFDGRSTRFDNLSMAPESYGYSDGGTPGGVPPGYNTDGPGLAPAGDADFTPF